MSMATAQPKTLRSDKPRTAYTLVELLVVMAALTVLAAVTLPSLKTLLHDQKVTAASRMVKAHFEAAQARAIASNSPVAVILERSDATLPNTVSRLSIGQVFPPYEGDTTGTTGTLSSVGGPFYNTLTVNVVEATLLTSAVFAAGDYLQLDDRQNIYVVDSVANGVIKFINPPFVLDANGDPVVVKEGDLLGSPRVSTKARFRIYRKPTKSFLQTLTLPRGTCIDLSVSGFGPGDYEFSTAKFGLTMIVFNPQGRIAYWTDGANGIRPATSLLHLLVGRTEQVSLKTSLGEPPEVATEVATEDDTASFNANVNDNANSWLTINPFTGAITSAGMQAGNEGSALAARLLTARAFATYGITQSEN